MHAACASNSNSRSVSAPSKAAPSTVMLSAGVSGFYNTPVSKAAILTIAVNSLSASILQGKPLLHLQLFPHVFTHHQFWRLASTHMAFTSSSEVLFGGILIYHMRLLERHWGSYKFASFILISSVVSTALDVMSLLLLSNFNITHVSPGPYAALSALAYNFVVDIPLTYRFKVMGVTVTDKMFVYLLGGQMLWCSWPHCLIPIVCGWITGMILKSDVAPVYIKKWRIPKRIWNIFDTYFLKLIQSDAPTSLSRESRSADGYASIPTTGPHRRNSTAGVEMPSRIPSNRPPSEANIQTLVTMGFERNAVIAALQATDDDVNAAASRLLE
ncbi:hypothetical protein SeMB42_g02576 [Synchytrium endobioticum]|uniref:UBA domain-containing protein n=1 Tax=Synchytrium endobioticum TaxID=286115 RepID=A0A507DHV5_9FUNG|nr:hypothetical protein SeMB42_g02576 [Synchytrium endobioticum]TPX50895.1 hypothetical protein SeLEV6574_g00629 [Synchytrium endobioticum]